MNRNNLNIKNTDLQKISPIQLEPTQFSNNNNLDLGKYLISEWLANCLKYGNSINNIGKKSISKEFFYIVIFNKIWNDKHKRYTLVYNYIKYNKIFFDLYYSYATIEQRYITRDKQNNIGAGYFFLLDNELNPKPNNTNELSSYEVFHNYRLDAINNHKNSNINKQVYYDFIEICKYITINLLTPLSLYDMSFIIANLTIIKPYLDEPRQIIASKLQNVSNYPGISTEYVESLISTMPTIDHKEKKELYNDISRFIFIVSDVRDLINCIKKSSIYTDTNPGPVKDRGGHSMIGNILYEFDRDFRHSMYNHYKLYKDRSDIDDLVYLRFDNFGYKNIHCNLGYCKW